MTPCRQCQSGQNKNGFHRTFVGTSHCSRLVRRDRQIRNIKHLLGISFTDISILEAFSAFSLPNRNNERWSGFPLYLFGNAEFPPLSKSSSSFILNHVHGFCPQRSAGLKSGATEATAQRQAENRAGKISVCDE